MERVVESFLQRKINRVNEMLPEGFELDTSPTLPEPQHYETNPVSWPDDDPELRKATEKMMKDEKPLHFVRFLISTGDSANVTFKCSAPEDASCRTVCKTCMDECREQCECAYWANDEDEEVGREPNIVHGQDCNILNWLNEDPEESYCGPSRPVKGPEWQPISPVWDGDYYTWHYVEDDDLYVPPNSREREHDTGEGYHNVGNCLACQREKTARERYQDA
jgi:hypothetical protein